MPPPPARPRRLVAAVCAGLVALGGAVQAQDAPPSTAELEALYWARQDSALGRFTDADVTFMTGMIGHHAQALVMSQYADRNGASPAVRTLAARIMNAQRDEIATMQRWLRDRGRPVPTFTVDGTLLTIATEGGAAEMDHGAMGHGAHGRADHGGMDPVGTGHGGMNHGEAGHDAAAHGAMNHGAMGHGGMDHALMPGMLTQSQLDELAAAQGADFDRLFLAYMIQHHGGAIVMVDDLLAADGAAQAAATFKLASEIHVDQRTEIARMQQMLDALD